MIPDSVNHWCWPWPQTWRGSKRFLNAQQPKANLKITCVVNVGCLRHRVAVLSFTASLQPWFWTHVCPTTCVHWVWHHSTWPVDAAGNSLVPNRDMLNCSDLAVHTRLCAHTETLSANGEQGLGVFLLSRLGCNYQHTIHLDCIVMDWFLKLLFELLPWVLFAFLFLKWRLALDESRVSNNFGNGLKHLSLIS